MRFNRFLVKKGFMFFIVLVCMFSFVHPSSARVDRTIQKAFEKLYEDKLFILRDDLILFGQVKGTPEFITDTYNFVYPDVDDDVQKTVVFEKGAKVHVKKVDFDKSTISISFRDIDSKRKGKIVFEFDERLSNGFYEKRDFTTRYDEIFLPDQLKEKEYLTDTISNIITSGRISIGSTRRDLLLTLGDPSDIVKHVTPDAVTEEWFYEDGGTIYQFIFEDGELREWIAHQERH